MLARSGVKSNRVLHRIDKFVFMHKKPIVVQVVQQLGYEQQIVTNPAREPVAVRVIMRLSRTAGKKYTNL